jgi:hypothetical protein
MTTDVPLLHGAVRVCEVCGGPDIGPLRCPHAIDPDRYPCPARKPSPVKGNNPYIQRSRRNNA